MYQLWNFEKENNDELLKDGVEDLIVGAPNADGNGCVYIFNGKETGKH